MPRVCCVLLLAGLLSGLAHADAAAPAHPVPVEAFFRRSVVADVVLSPSGKYLATISAAAGGNDVLAVTDLATRDRKVVSLPGVDVLHAVWVGDERLVYQVGARAGGGTVLVAVDRDGGSAVALSDESHGYAGPGSHPLADWSTFLTAPCHARNADVIYATYQEMDWSDTKLNLLRIDTRTNRGGTLERPGRVAAWMLDQAGQPDLVTVDEVDHTLLLARSNPDSPWRTLADYANDDPAAAIVPLQFGPDGTLYVTAAAGADQRALYTFDLARGRLAPTPLFATPGHDFAGRMVATCGKVLGVHFVTDAESITWLDPAMKDVQAAIDSLLPDTKNLITVPVRAETPWMLVRAYSDIAPAAYWLFNADTRELAPVAGSRIAIDGTQLGHQHMVHYRARDGLDIPARLTLPPGPRRQDLPLIVLVHGGPWLHGPIWGFDSESQFLASRGYAVLEPAFRGSTGYGQAFYRAGWKQWGRAMQDDLADGARWAVAQGYADPHRICIGGGSYGGYAALMGLVNDPDVYRCGIDWTGITDLDLVFDGTWSFPSYVTDRFRQHGFKEMIGDPDKDATQLAATSPIRQAARIKQPLLLAYGGLDGRVPIAHGTRLRDAVRRTNPDVEWIEYPDQEHGWSTVSVEADFWTRVERFLARTIGPGAPPGN